MKKIHLNCDKIKHLDREKKFDIFKKYIYKKYNINEEKYPYFGVSQLYNIISFSNGTLKRTGFGYEHFDKNGNMLSIYSNSLKKIYRKLREEDKNNVLKLQLGCFGNFSC